MRNKIAHEYSSLVLNPDSDVIELLNDTKLKENFSAHFVGFNISDANEETKSI